MRDYPLLVFLCAIVLAGACGRYTGTTEASADGGVSDSSAPVMDASPPLPDVKSAVDAGLCDLSAPFGPIVRLDTVSDTLRNEWSAWISDDELTMVFTRQDNEGQKNYLAKRSSKTTSFVQNAQVESDRSATERSAGPAVAGTTTNDTNFIFASAAGGSPWVLYRAPLSLGTFTVGPSALFSSASPVSLQLPAFADPSELYFIRGDYLGAGGQLFRTQVSAAGASTPEAVSEINGIFDSVGNMTFSPDGLTLYFGAKLFGSPTDFDIYKATRASKARIFGAPERIDELATATADFEAPVKISADGCRIYLSANRKGSSIDLFVASKPVSTK
jgi:hypothetical protein